MEHIINRIINIEQRAQQVLKDAKDKKQNIDNIVEAQLEKINAEYTEKLKTRVKAIDENEAEAANEQIARIKTQYDAKIAHLSEIVKINIDKWVETVYESIITSDTSD